jgi:5-(carboxyamino)imidazole ribonucleotide synthase
MSALTRDLRTRRHDSSRLREDAWPVLQPPATLGVVGSGQLGRMFVHAAQRLGYRAAVLGDDLDAPAAQLAHRSIIGSSSDLAAVREFARLAEAVTVEFENVSAPALRWMSRFRPVRPGWKTVWTAQNRLREKTFLSRHGFPLTRWRPVRSEAELTAAVRELGLPLILKTAASGYDGKGQVLLDHAGKAEAAWQSLERAPCVAEAWVDFAAEVSVVVARSRDGSAVAYPVAQNEHRRHILDSTVMPAPVGPCLTLEARCLALSVAQALGTIGVLTVEYFLTGEGRLLINELAPRPHNSGHVTIEAALCSQFEQQVRALCGLPLGGSDLIMPAAMVNLLGDLWSRGEPLWDRALGLDPGVRLHLYGKTAPAPGRKMGHLTVLDPDPATALARAKAARQALLRDGS